MEREPSTWKQVVELVIEVLTGWHPSSSWAHSHSRVGSTEPSAGEQESSAGQLHDWGVVSAVRSPGPTAEGGSGSLVDDINRPVSARDLWHALVARDAGRQ